jgi:cytoskeletal protein RodZ
MASFGEILKRERELRGITLREISEATKISIRHLEALEDSRITSLPGGLFNKGFIRAYALHVGIDPDEMINNYLYDVGQMEQQDPLDSLRALVPPEPGRPATRWRQWAVLGAIIAGGMILFALLSFWPTGESAPARPETATPAAPQGEARVADDGAGDSGAGLSGPAPAGTAAADETPKPDPPAAATASPPPVEEEPAEVPPREQSPAPGDLPPYRPTPVEIPTHLTFEMEMRHTARVRILCDGTEVLNKRLGAGERRVFTCRDLQLSTSDAASFRYRLNDDGWVVPDETGRPLEDFRLTPADLTGRSRGARLRDSSLPPQVGQG